MIERGYPHPQFAVHFQPEEFVLWMCPECGKTIRWPTISAYVPDTICKCRYPDHITQMVIVWPRGES